jgi:hypothetical protein
MIPQLTKKTSRHRLTPPVGRLKSEVYKRIILLELRSRSIIPAQEDSMIDDLYDLIGGRQKGVCSQIPKGQNGISRDTRVLTVI